MNEKPFLKNCFIRAENFVSKISLNGFSYIMNKNLDFFDWILWSFIILIQFYFCYQYSAIILNRKDHHPVLLAYESKSTHVIRIILYQILNYYIINSNQSIF